MIDYIDEPVKKFVAGPQQNNTLNTFETLFETLTETLTGGNMLMITFVILATLISGVIVGLRTRNFVRTFGAVAITQASCAVLALVSVAVLGLPL
jgi:NADH:ubiquinone oxidoreductase subunit 2 (subunit N)